MAEDPTVRSQVNASYDWPNPNIDDVVAAIENDILPFFSGHQVLSGTLSQEAAPEVYQQHASLDSWKAALSTAWDRMTLDITADNGSAHVELLPTRRQLSLKFNTTDAQTEPLTDMLEAFQASMLLDSARTSTYQPNDRLEGHYHADPGDGRWFEELLNKLATWVGKCEHFN